MPAKTTIDFLAKPKEREGQGVHSASFEDFGLISELGQDAYTVYLNRHLKSASIVQACDVHPSFYAKLGRNHPTIAMVHFLPETLDGSINLPGFAFRAFKSYVMRFYRKADELVTVNPVFVERLVALGFDRGRVTYIPNYVSSAQFRPLSVPKKIEARQRWGLSDGSFVVLACGQTQPRKGIYDFLAVAEDNPEMTFVWAGGFTFGNLTSEHAKIRKTLANLPPNVRFLGIVPRAEMNSLYNAADVFFSPSYGELFPMTMLEAASVNLPILVRDLSLYEPILFDKVLRGRDNLGFSAILKQLRTDPVFRSEQGLRSADLSAMYAKEKVYAIWDSYYRQLLVKYDKA